MYMFNAYDLFITYVDCRSLHIPVLSSGLTMELISCFVAEHFIKCSVHLHRSGDWNNYLCV